MSTPENLRIQRQALLWRTLSAAFSQQENNQNLESLSLHTATEQNLPAPILNTSEGIDTFLHRHPELQAEFDSLHTLFSQPEGADTTSASQTAPEPSNPFSLRHDLLFSKLLVSVFGPRAMQPAISAADYSQWTQDVTRLEVAFGCAPGTLRNKRGGSSQSSGAPSSVVVPEHIDLNTLQKSISDLEADLIKRMALRDVLQNSQLAAQLTPSLPLVEQLLWDKANLSGEALKNAKKLILKYVDDLAQVLRFQVMQAAVGKPDRSVPPKRIFKNLDIKKTLWKNLIKWDPEQQRLFVDQLYFRHTAKKTITNQLIIVVDQSGSMVDAMIQCTILASIFASLPNVEAHLVAFDTRTIDLTPWVKDPFEVLLRTKLGGGTHILSALQEAAKKIEEPSRCTFVLISDFYEGGSNEALLNYIKELKSSGVHFIPVGSVTSSGYFSVSDWFRTRLKSLGMPILNGNINKLILQLKSLL